MYIIHVITEDIILYRRHIFVTVTRAKFVAGPPGALCSHPALIGTAFVKDNETRTKSYNVAIDYVKGSNGNYFPKIYLQTDRDSWKLLSYNGGKTAEDAIGITAQHAKIFPLQVDDLFIKSLLQSK